MAYETIKRISKDIVDKGKPFYVDRRKFHFKENSEKQEVIDYFDYLEKLGIYEFNRTNGKYEPGENFEEYINKKEEVLEIHKRGLELLTLKKELGSPLTKDMRDKIKRYGETLKQLGEIKAIRENYHNNYKKDKRKQ
ncbi:MAG TPA: hypothetical protein VJ912_01295 [Candidatus Nanoarchaeia archaeon]|nr:hypothetical protein [Candidatus Nanoarchaeia archaeon]